MESFLSRYRNLSILVLVVFCQLLLLAYQVRTKQDVRLIRVWAVSAVTPAARFLEGVRSSAAGFVSGYIALFQASRENAFLRKEIGRLKLENQFLRSELATAERAKALAAFVARTPSRTVAARVIGTGTGLNSKVVLIDRGTGDGLRRGMAVITPDGIVGRIQSVYPNASQVLLITDPTFAAGVISQRRRVRGTLKGLGQSLVMVDYVQNEEKVEPGEWFYTSGDDRIFPKGLPVGQVRTVKAGRNFQEIFLAPSGLAGGLEEVLVVVEGVHEEIPPEPPSGSAVYLLPPPPQDESEITAAPRGLPALATDADRLLEKYRQPHGEQAQPSHAAGAEPPPAVPTPGAAGDSAAGERRTAPSQPSSSVPLPAPRGVRER